MGKKSKSYEDKIAKQKAKNKKALKKIKKRNKRPYTIKQALFMFDNL